MSKFAVVILQDEKKAYDALHALRELHADGSVTLYATNVVQRDPHGKLNVLKRDESGVIGVGIGTLVGGLVGLFGGPAGVVVGAAAGASAGGVRDLLHLDLSDEFLETIEHELQPGCFAVVAELSEDWVAPLDTRMAELGGKVVREEREAFREELMEKRVTSWKAELGQRKVEHAQRKAQRELDRAGRLAEKQEQAVTAEIAAARAKLLKMADRADEHLGDLKREFDAKLEALQDQAAVARPEVKSRIDERIAALRSELAGREEKLKRAKALTLEALQAQA